jgi:hypothetical protein
MPTARPHRRLAAFVAASSLFFVEACHAYQRPPPGKGISFDSRVRLQSVEPFAVLPVVADTGAAVRDCRATRVEGHVAKASPDSLTFRGLVHVVPANSDAASCQWAKTSSVIVPIAGADVAVNRVSGKRTAILLLVITAAVVGFAAFAASQIDYGLGSGGDCAFC